jgi:WD40 repeat protein
MSPEQAGLSALDIDTRSDIYSLGVLLYELLTGKTPFDSKRLVQAGLDEIRRIIREEEPPRPSTRISTLADAEQTAIAKRRQSGLPKLLGIIQGDLDWIVMKTLEKDRTRRYETASGLALDLQHYLNSEPVAARPPSQLYRFQKLVRRNQLAVGAVGAVMAALLIGLGFSTWMFLKESQARQRAVAAEQTAARHAAEEATQRKLAEAAATEARMTVAQLDFLQASRLIAEGKGPEAMAYLARSLRANPTNAAAITRLTTLLTYDTWMIPQLVLQHPSEVMGAGFSPDGKRISTGSGDCSARWWDAQTGQALAAPMFTNLAQVTESLDGKRIGTASYDGTVRVWDAHTGKPVAVLLKETNTVCGIQFSPDGSRLVTDSEDGTARVWDASTGQPLTDPLRHSGRVSSARFSPDGTRVVTASWDGTARVWDAQTGQPLTGSLLHNSLVDAAQFSPDGMQILTASEDWTARVWDAQTGQALTPPMKHSAPVWNAEFSPDGKRIVTGSEDHTARIWDSQTGRALSDPLAHNSAVRSAHFSPDGKCIATASGDHTARLWDAQAGKPLTQPMKHGQQLWSARFSPDGSQVVTASEDHTAQVWDAHPRRALPEILAHHSQVFSAVFSPDGKRIATASQDWTARIWDAQTGQAVTEPLKHTNVVWSVQFSPDGKRVVTASWDHTARVWDARTGQPLTVPLSHSDIVRSAQFSPDGKRIITGSEDGTARIWDAQTGQSLAEPLQHTNKNTRDWNAVYSAQFSPDGTRAATASDDCTARIWDAQTGHPLTRPLMHDGPVRSVEFSPDGRRIVTSSWDNTARVWDAQTGQILAEPLRHKGWPVMAHFSLDGTRIVTASCDHTARIWDAKTGHPLTEPMAHTATLQSARFSPDGKRVVTASDDRSAQVWDVEAGQLVLRLAHNSGVWAAEFSPDATRIVTASGDGIARVWDVAPSETEFPDWLLRLAEVASGQVLGTRGKLEDTKLDRSAEMSQLRQTLNQKSQTNDWAVWGRWFLADSATRTISPFSSQSIPGYVEGLVRDSTVEAQEQPLDEAEVLASGNAELRRRIEEGRRPFELRRQAQQMAAQGKFAEAATILATVIELVPNDLQSWSQRAVLLAHNRDTEGFCKIREAMLARFGGTWEPRIANPTARTWLLLPSSGSELTAASRLAELTVTAGKSNGVDSWNQDMKGLSEYRQGHFATALEWGREFLSQPSLDNNVNVQATSVLAMAYYQSGQTNEARTALAKAKRVASTKLPKLNSGAPGSQWHAVLVSLILLREATELIEGKVDHDTPPVTGGRRQSE